MKGEQTMKPLYFRDISDKLKIKFMQVWEQKKMVKLLTKLKREQDVTVGWIADPGELLED